MEAVEMEGIESALGEVPIEEEESLVGNRDSADVMELETKVSNKRQTSSWEMASDS